MLTIGGLGLGGAEMVVNDLARHLDKNKFDISICCTKGLGGEVGEELLHDGYDLCVLPGQHDDRVDYFTALKLRRVIKQKQIDIIHTHATSALLDAAPCRLTMPGLKLIHTFHYGNYPYESWRHHLLEGLCARTVDRLIAVGIEQRERILQTYKLRKSRIDTIWNGILAI